MKSCFESLLIALSMYSTLPVKCLNWNAKNLRLAMLFFPIVGLLCGGGLWLVWTVCQLLHRSAYLFAVVFPPWVGENTRHLRYHRSRPNECRL